MQQPEKGGEQFSLLSGRNTDPHLFRNSRHNQHHSSFSTRAVRTSSWSAPILDQSDPSARLESALVTLSYSNSQSSEYSILLPHLTTQILLN